MWYIPKDSEPNDPKYKVIFRGPYAVRSFSHEKTIIHIFVNVFYYLITNNNI